MYYIPLSIIGFFVFFAGLWCAVMSILSLISGWNRLSKKFAATEQLLKGGREFTFQSARFRMINYSLCTTVRILDDGIAINVIKLFSFMHKPLFIPFNEIIKPSYGKFIMEFVVFHLNGTRIEIQGSSAEEIRLRLKALQP